MRVLIIGGGIGGLTCAIALRGRGFSVELIERDPGWSVYGVGIIQQSNVVRAMAALGVLEDYLGAAFPFDHVDIHGPDGRHLARVPSPKLTADYPANVGIGRPALHDVLGRRARAAGTHIRLGLTARRFEQGASGVLVEFSDGTSGRFDLVVGADGLHSTTRSMIFADAPQPEFTGQGVWRHNFPQPAEVAGLQVYEGAIGTGLVPLSKQVIYMYVVTAEPGNPRYGPAGLAAAMRGKLLGAPPLIAQLSRQIVRDSDVVYRPLESLFLTGDWHQGRIVLLGDAVHASTPHLGQGAGMAIEDSLVLAEELARSASPEQAFSAYRSRRFERCKYIVDRSRAIGDGQLGRIPRIDQAGATKEMFEMVSAPI